MKKQIIIIHGGHIFNTRKDYLSFLFDYKIDFKKIIGMGWKESLGEKLGKGYEVVLPKMPCPSNAKYVEWKIWFEKLFPFLEGEVVLVGHSLGGIFLVKYLSENKFPKKILAILIVAAPYDDKDPHHSLVDFKLKKDSSGLQNQAKELFFYHSQDDDVVSFAAFKKYKKALPSAHFKEFKNKGHFGQSTFPEIIKDIKRIFKV
ncbi:MAG: alpha/beta hydrolase [bacterium]